MDLTKTKATKGVLCMDRITREAHHRQRMMKYLQKHGVTETAMRYKTSRKTVIKWRKRWDGTVDSLKDSKPEAAPKPAEA